MDERGQFTFYRSFWEAVKGLPKKDRLPILEAIISYALDGVTPSGLSQSQSAFFLLVKPNLDASRKKAASGKQGGSKPKAKGKQTQREKENEDEKENEKENEIEIEIEVEKEYKCNNFGGGSSTAGARATNGELASIGLKPGEYPCVTKLLVSQIRELGVTLYRTYVMHSFCAPADCRNIFRYVVRDGTTDSDAVGLLEYAFEAAHRAGKSGNWNYIEAVLVRCSQQNIYTAEQARDADEERESHE